MPAVTYKGLKRSLPTKYCLVCNRPFQYRKKWKTDWAEVKYCSQKCKQEHKTGQNKPKSENIN